MIRPAAVCLAWLLLAAIALGLRADEPAGDVPRFETDVAPILQAHCQRCHGDEKSKAGLNLASATTIARGGESGPAVVPGKAEESLLVELVLDRTMPPEDEGSLSEQEIELIRRWVATGATAEVPVEPLAPRSTIDPQAREFWSFRPLSRPTVPNSGSTDKLRTPLDAFVVARLAEHELTLSPQADRLTLLRRLSFDLLGLPPSPEQIEAFLADHRPDAYERLVDRLLASPHFGERWGRHWLDAAGYSDITGGDNDAGIIKLSEGKWKYRDYVVQAFNDDMPYDRFVVEQLAGDELVDWRHVEQFTDETKELLIATGFLRGAADDTDERELTTPDILNGVLQRTSEVVASNLLGLTLGCAKCHDHKYEPIPQRDYYSLLAAFTPVFNPAAWVSPKERALADIAPARKAEAEKHNAEIDRQLGEIKKQSNDIRGRHAAEIVAAKRAALHEAIRDDVVAAVETPQDKRTEVQKYLAEKFTAALTVAPQELDAALTDAEEADLADFQRRSAELEATRRTWGKIQAAYEVGPPPVTHVLRRGNHETPGAPVEPGFLTVLCSADRGDAWGAGSGLTDQAIGPTSGRRLALAHCITDWESPSGALAARVYVNRVWQHLFGHGIVETTENLGMSGAPPTHPQLLEWLACQFVADGRRTKALVKLLVTSHAYRQASARAAESAQAAMAADPGNALLWHMPLRRLEAEIVRDAILSVSGQLSPELGGPALPLETRPDGSVVIQETNLPPNAKSRRSLYVLARRNYHLSILNVFDQPAMAMNCPHRQQSAVVLQSLAMLNDDFVVEQARRFAERVRSAAATGDSAALTELAFRIALARPPSQEESSWSQQLLAEQAAEAAASGASPDASARQALVHLCHMLLNSNEFLYIQ